MTVEQSIGYLDASAAREVGNYAPRDLRIDLKEASQQVLEMKTEVGLLQFPSYVVVRHNGLTDSNCHECGGGGLEAEVFVSRPETAEELKAEAVREEERLAKAERRRRRDYQRLKGRYDGE